MSFEISCHLRFRVNLNLFQISIEWFRTLKPISGGMDGWMDGRLSPFDGLLRAPTVLIKKVDSFKPALDWEVFQSLAAFLLQIAGTSSSWSHLPPGKHLLSKIDRNGIYDIIKT